jgi:protein-S-isoprenylcysteine O-methyltransferase Ste14
LIPIIIAIIFAILHVLTALREEKNLLERFGREYEEYMRRVPWKFIPRVF